MWRLVGIAAVACGCGRFNFDPGTEGGAADARVCTDPIGHDEDLDGFDDACDACPQLADDQRDSDGDGVGDACDLAVTQETRTVFDPFMVMRAAWDYDSGITFNGDSITMPAIGRVSYVDLNDVPGRTVLEIGGRVTMAGPTSPQIAIHIGEGSGTTNYYCELYDASGPFELKLTHYNNAYFTLGTTPIPGNLTAGAPVRMLFEHLPPSLRCVAWWDGVRYEVSAADPGGVPLNAIYFAVNDIYVEMEYAVRLAAP